MYDGYLCDHFDEENGICMIGSPNCCDPFSEESCLAFQQYAQRKVTYWNLGQVKSYYTPSEQKGFNKKYRKDIFDAIQSYEDGHFLVIEHFIPKYHLESLNIPVYIVIEIAENDIRRSFAESGNECSDIKRIFGYVQPMGQKEVEGILLIGIG